MSELFISVYLDEDVNVLVAEFIRLQNKYHNNQLYAENIRLYLGDRGAVNKDIISTMQTNSQH